MHTLRGWRTQPRETCRNKRGIRRCGPFRIWNWEWRRCDKENRLFIKQPRGHPMHPVNQTAREVQKLFSYNAHTIYTCLQSQFIIRKQYSRSSGRSTDENTMTPVDDDLDVNVAICACLNATLQATVHLGQDCETNLRYVKNNLWNSVGLLFHETGKLFSEQKEITGVSTFQVSRMPRGCRQGYCAKRLIRDHQYQSVRLLRLCALRGKHGRWSNCDLEEQN